MVLTRRLKPVEIGLGADIQQAVLSLPLEVGGSLTTVGALVKRAEEDIQLANQVVRGNALIRMAADSIMKREKRRGTPHIIIHINGSVVLQITYDEEEGVEVSVPEVKLKKLPSLDDLRVQSQEMGVDISDLGRQKRKIIERLSSHRSNGQDHPNAHP